MADIWSLDSDEAFQKQIASYKQHPTRESFQDILKTAKKLALEKARQKNFQELESLFATLLSLPQQDTSQNFLDQIWEALDIDPFWEILQTSFSSLPSQEKEGILKVIQRMPSKLLPSLIKLLANIPDPEPIYKAISHVGNKDITPLIEILIEGEKKLAYQAHIVLKHIQSPVFLKHISILKHHSKAEIRSLTAHILRVYDSPGARLELFSFLKDSDPLVRRAALLTPAALALPALWEDLKDMLIQNLDLWDKEDLVKLAQALLLADEKKTAQWVEDLFTKKGGLFGKNQTDKLKEKVVEALTKREEPFCFELAGKILRGDQYIIAQELREKLVEYGEKSKIQKAKTTGRYSRQEIQDLMKQYEEGKTPSPPDSLLNQENSPPKTDSAPLISSPEGSQGTPEKQTIESSGSRGKNLGSVSVLEQDSSFHKKEAFEKKNKTSKESQPFFETETVNPSQKPIFSPPSSLFVKPTSYTKSPEKDDPKMKEMKNKEKIKSPASPKNQTTPSLKGLEEVIELELANTPTQDLDDDLGELANLIIKKKEEEEKNQRKKSSLSEELAQEMENLHQIVEKDLASSREARIAEEDTDKITISEKEDQVLNELAEEVSLKTAHIKTQKLTKPQEVPSTDQTSSNQTTSGSSAKSQTSSVCSPSLLFILSKELCKTDPGKFLNLLKKIYSAPSPNPTIEAQKEELLYILSKIYDRNILMFLDFMFHSQDRFHLPENGPSIIEELLKKEGFL
ncbi:MAG: HEAT repeat domain-containing protein [Planctomycetota bacterium]|nr:MAG: HEAT repeat domain-containing protein [Planctomycetota bacterium]